MEESSLSYRLQLVVNRCRAGSQCLLAEKSINERKPKMSCEFGKAHPVQVNVMLQVGYEGLYAIKLLPNGG